MKVFAIYAMLALNAVAIELPKAPVKAEMTDINGAALQLPMADQKATVLIFLATECPIANAYAAEIGRIYAEFADKGIGFCLVYCAKALSDADCRKHTSEYRLPGRALRDPQQRLVAATGVKVTPEVAILKPDGSLCYRGRIDNLYARLGLRRQVVSKRELRDVLTSLVADKSFTFRQVEAIGCFIE